MKKLFTIDDFMVAFISALGYGFGYTIPMHLGWPQLACIVTCFALGIALEEITGKIVFSKAVQKKTANRVFTYVAILLVFLIAEFVSVRLLGASLMEDLEEEFAWVVGLPILGLVVSLCIRAFRVRKIRKLYGDGSEGYVFDLKKEDIEETNRQNQPILGQYDAELAVKTRTGVYVGEKYKNTISIWGFPMQSRRSASSGGRRPNRSRHRRPYLRRKTSAHRPFRSSTRARSSSITGRARTALP